MCFFAMRRYARSAAYVSAPVFGVPGGDTDGTQPHRASGDSDQFRGRKPDHGSLGQLLAERARGGCGLIVTEIIAVDPEALAHGAIVTGYEDANDAGFERVADEVHAAGSCILGQLLGVDGA